jgi:integrase
LEFWLAMKRRTSSRAVGQGQEEHRSNHLHREGPVGSQGRGGEQGDKDLVFGSSTGTPWAPQNLVRRNFKPLLKRAGLPDIRFHDLRHTCATLLFSRNVHPKVVQEMLGHSTISLTLDTYSHYVPSLGEGATLAMEEMVTVEETHNNFHNDPVGYGPVEDPTGLIESSPVGRDLSF